MKNYFIKEECKKAIDTNILVYAFQNDNLGLKNKSIDLFMNENLVVSHFVLIEFIHIIHTISKMDKRETLKLIIESLGIIRTNYCYMETYNLAYFIVKRYRISLKDSIIIADAILNDCSILYSRDMQHNQIFEKKIRIINPFI
ncbi:MULTISPECIES: PIN domain-containing protein [Empedobacter]|uniref:PIN domain-containing protein n=1 Tax=Empedobacter TaxID=59734 RepID=UPI0025778A54|nr:MULTISPECIES: PIN domain-containing protein [unclassified Empedobacter]MDM1138517.1 PIN domain-containing protein [Empedobacter sp. R132-2]